MDTKLCLVVIDWSYHISILTWILIFIIMPVSITYAVEKIINKTGKMPVVIKLVNLVIEKYGN